MTVLAVISCGSACSVQDAGRFGYRRFGVPTAGAMDRTGLAVANALAGNAPDAAAIELALAGGRFTLSGGAALVAVAGAPLAVDGRTAPPGQSLFAPEGADIAVGAARPGVFSYLAIAGAIAAPEVMGSRSVHVRTGIGGTALRAGDRLPVGPARSAQPLRLPEHLLAPPGRGDFRVLAGPQLDEFADDAIERLCTEEFIVDPQSDRMAYRLLGPPLIHLSGHNIVSDGVVAGSIQVPGDRRPLVLMRDCQTTGGYPKIATVISADLHRLAQAKPGTSVRFRMVSQPEAVAAARHLRGWLDRLAREARPAARMPGSAELLAQNLIGGVTDGKAEPSMD